MAEITTKLSNKNVKPNVLIYADSLIARNNVKGVLEESLGMDKYDNLFILALNIFKYFTYYLNMIMIWLKIVCLISYYFILIFIKYLIL